MPYFLFSSERCSPNALSIGPFSLIRIYRLFTNALFSGIESEADGSIRYVKAASRTKAGRIGRRQFSVTHNKRQPG